MVVFEHTLLVLLIILSFGLILPDIFKRFRVPFVTTLILIGALFGPFGLNYVQANDTIEFFGFLGSMFLMLLAGLEARSDRFIDLKHRVTMIALINGSIPLFVGIMITKLFGFSWTASFIVGTLFVSSSVAIISSAIHEARLHKKEIGRVTVGAAIIEDIMSLLLLSLILQSIQPLTKFPLPIYFGILVSSFIVLKMFIPEITMYFFGKHQRSHIAFEGHVRYILAVLIAVILYFDTLGVHSIVGAFLVGVLLADVVTSETVHEKLHSIGYGLFVPVFFFIVGMELDLSLLMAFDITNLLVLALIVGLIASKFISGYVATRMENFSSHEAMLFGTASCAQLTTTLAAAFAAHSLGIIGTELVTAVIVVAVITTLFVPFILNIIARKVKANV